MNKVTLPQQDTLILVDGMAALMTFDDSHVFTLHCQEGYAEVASLITEGKLEVKGYKFIVLLVGRADLWETDKSFKVGVNACHEVIRDRNKYAIILFAATLPSPGDAVRIIRTASYRNGFLSQFACDHMGIEFTKPGKYLMKVRGGPDLEFFDEFNNLNQDGLDQIRRALEAKFRCAKLRLKYESLIGRTEG